MATPWTGTKPGTFVDDSTAVPLSAANMNAIVDTLNDSVATVRKLDSGKILHLSANGLPEYPDSTAGTTYLNPYFTAADGWTADACTLSYSGGKMVVTATGTNPRIYRAITAAKTIRARVKRISGAATNTAFVATSGELSTNNFDSAGNALHDWYIPAGATGNISIRAGSSGSAASDVYEISFIYIGDGTNSSKMPDVSGNGNDGTVYGATPVDGIAGKALRGDGTNDYVSCGDVLNITEALSIAAWVKSNASTASSYGIAGKYVASASNRQYMLEMNGGVTPRFLISADGATATTLSAPTGEISTTVFEHLCAVFIPSTAMYLYRNGVLVATNTTSIPASIAISNTPFTLMKSITGAGYAGIAIDDPRIYNRALSAAEVWELYQKPKQAGGPVNGTQICNLIGRNNHIDGESSSIGSTFQAKFASDEYTYPASCISAPTTNAGNVIVNSGATYDTFLAYDGTTNVAYRGYRAHGTGAPTWTVVFSSGATMPSGANLAFASGNGISFAATADAAGMTSELLADYEEGTWTPGVSFGGGTTGIIYTTQEGRYTKIGNRVIFSGYIVTSSKGSSTGSALITGLPYTCFNSTGARGVVGLSIAGISFADYPSGFVSANSTAISLFESTNAGSETALADTDFSNSSVLRISGAYATS